MRVLVAGPFPPSPDVAASAALRTVQDLLHEGHAVEVMSPLPSAADHHGPLAGLKGAVGLARRARGFDALHLQVSRGLLFRPEQPQARRVLDSALLALSLRLWPGATLPLSMAWKRITLVLPGASVGQVADRFGAPAAFSVAAGPETLTNDPA